MTWVGGDDADAAGAAGAAGAADSVRSANSLGPEPAAFVLPRIPASAGALIFDELQRLLIVNPTYKAHWSIPGGIMEADGETPWEACRREVREEVGLDVGHARLAAVDFLRPKSSRPGGMRFLFDCGVLPTAVLDGIRLQEEELSEHRLVHADEAFSLLSGPLSRRVRAVLAAPGACVYLENGRTVRAMDTQKKCSGKGPV